MFEAILAELVANHIRFVLIGGVAAAVHGSARYTNDIDICYDCAPDNVERLVALLTEWNACLRGVDLRRCLCRFRSGRGWGHHVPDAHA